MVEKILISILIPTVTQRNSSLVRTLDSVLELLNHLNGYEKALIRVTISGNPYNEFSHSLAKKYGFHYRYEKIKQEVEIHGINLLKNINSDYIYMLADDDVINIPGFLVLFNALKKKKYSLIIGKNINFIDRLPSPIKSTKILETKIESLQEYIEKTKLNLIFSTFVFHKSYLSFDNYNKYLGTFHALFGMVNEGVFKDPNILVIDEVVVFTEQSEKTWDKPLFETWIGLQKYFHLLPEPLGINSSNAIRSSKLSLRLMVNHMLMIYSKEEKTLMEPYFSLFSDYRFHHKVVFKLMPLNMIKIIRKIF